MAENDFPTDVRYTKEHEWVRVVGDEATIGITEFAQSSLGDIVFVEVPEPGDEVTQHETFGSVEAVKAVSDLYCPVSGEVVAINDAVDADPALVNRSPFGEGWMIRVKLSDPTQPDGLLDAGEYKAFVDSLEQGDS